MAEEQGLITAIGAISSNDMLGLNGWLPWDIPEELAYFEQTVAGAALVIDPTLEVPRAAPAASSCARRA